MVALHNNHILKQTLKREIHKNADHVLPNFPLEKYIEILGAYPKYKSYQYCSDEMTKYCRGIVKYSDKSILSLYHKLVLINLVEKNENSINKKNIPKEIKQDYLKDFRRIISCIESDSKPSDVYLYPNDGFFKMLSICSMKMFPVGARKYEYSRFPLRCFLKQGYVQLVQVILYLLLITKGREPFLQVHWDANDPNLKNEINIQGVIYSNRVIAKMMKMDTRIKGKYGCSWVMDPQLERISPRHTILRYFSLANGVRLFNLGPSGSAIRHATATSQTRKRLYDLGEYIPSVYMDVWDRSGMIYWYDKLDWRW